MPSGESDKPAPIIRKKKRRSQETLYQSRCMPQSIIKLSVRYYMIDYIN